MIIAVDGPAASGKGTLASGLARHYNLPYLDTGLLYRAVGRAVEAYENSPEFEQRAIAAAQTLDENDIEPEFLLSSKIGTLASKVAVIGAVRSALFEYQREFATQEGTLYPLLSRLRRESLVDYEWQESGSGPPRKYYRLTAAGQRAVSELQGYWQHLTETLNRIGS